MQLLNNLLEHNIMEAYIDNKKILIGRLNSWIEAMEYVLQNRRDLFWSRYGFKNGKIIHIGINRFKEAFKKQFIGRYEIVLKAIETNQIHELDWIEYRDVLYNVCFSIDMLGKKSYKALRESEQPIMIDVKGVAQLFKNSVMVHKQFI